MLLESLSIGYSAPVVSAIDAELLSGRFICLVGRNGSGKSTLLKTLAGMIAPISGHITGPRPKEGDSNYINNVGIVLTHIPMLSNTTVFEMVSYGRIPHQNIIATLRPEDINAIDSAIEKVGIGELRNRKLDELSDGEKQKVMIARTIAQGTDTILLDEPSAFLDYPSKRTLMELLTNLAHNENKAILLSTHDIEMAKQFADTIWHIKDGSLNIVSPGIFEPENI